jgi:hypothetical protein
MTFQISDILNPPRNGEVARRFFMGVTEGQLVGAAMLRVRRATAPPPLFGGPPPRVGEDFE